MENRSRAASLYDELIRDNAMTDEVVRYVRKTWRGSGSGGMVANVIVGAMIALLYVWMISSIVKWNLFITLGIEYVELAVVTLVAPASIYAAISGEREKATWDALVLTRLTPAQIIAGKLAWRVAMLLGVMALLLLPLLVSQMQRGMGEFPDASGVLLGQGLIFAWGLLLTAFSLWVSARTARSVTSIGIIISAVIGVLAMLPALLSAFGLSFGAEQPRSAWDVMSTWILALNPFVLLGAVSEGERVLGRSAMTSPSTALMVILLYLVAAALFVLLTHRTVKRLSGE